MVKADFAIEQARLAEEQYGEMHQLARRMVLAERDGLEVIEPGQVIRDRLIRGGKTHAEGREHHDERHGDDLAGTDAAVACAALATTPETRDLHRGDPATGRISHSTRPVR
jgi:hypothetical protein